MLYLEDYLEMIEHLPQELRDRFTEMRELDLAVQNNMDSLDKKSRLFFQQCKRGELQHDSMDNEFSSLRGDYFKVMEDADEKVAIATQIHELVERYLRRLDSELFKFKCELEADNNGITEILEKRSLELDGNNSTAATALLLSMNQKENRYYNQASNIVQSNLLAGNINSAAGIITTGAGVVSAGGSLLVGNSGLGGLTGNITSGGSTVMSSGHQRHRKLEKRRETICTVPVQEKRSNLNQSLPVVGAGLGGHSMHGGHSVVHHAAAGHQTSSHSGASLVIPVAGNHVNTMPTHVTLPVVGGGVGAGNLVNATVAGNLVRQLPTNLTAHTHNVIGGNTGATHSSNVAAAVAAVAAAAAAGVANNNVTVGGTTIGTAGAVGGVGGVQGVPGSHGNTTVSYNLHQLGGGASASSAIAAAASQAIVATQQMPQGRRTASLKASYEAIHHGAGVGAGSTEFWSAAAAAQQHGQTQLATGTLTNTGQHPHAMHQQPQVQHQQQQQQQQQLQHQHHQVQQQQQQQHQQQLQHQQQHHQQQQQQQQVQHHHHQQQTQQQQQQQHHHHHHQHHHHHHHQEKKHKKKLNASLSVPGGIAVKYWDGSSSGNSIASNASSMSVDSVDILSNAAATAATSALQQQQQQQQQQQHVGQLHHTTTHGALSINAAAVLQQQQQHQQQQQQQQHQQLSLGHGTVGAVGGGVVATAASLPVVNTVQATAMGLPTGTLAPGTNLTISDAGLVVEQTQEGEWSYDPNEPRYCTCNQVSYGDMVACDNDACPYEWFHYPCVGITQPPKGKWYCPKCTASMRRRGNRKN